MSSEQFTLILVSVLGGGGLATVVIKLLSRRGDDATAESTLADVRTKDIENLRGIINELRTSEAKKDERINNLERRMLKLEERERHMLTRAAVHEAWDQLAFQMLIQSNPNHPPPPPLSEPARLAPGVGDPDQP